MYSLKSKLTILAYQTFVDLLTTNNKSSSSAFLNLYTTLSDAPDPFPLLEASVESLVAQEDTVPRLETENDELRRRVQRLTTQLETSEQRLEEETVARRSLNETSDTKTKEIEESWSKALEEKQANWEAKEKSLEEKVESQEHLLRELKASYDVAQRLNHKGDNSNDSLNKVHAAELDLVSAELEKATSRVAELQARNEQLAVEAARAASDANTDRNRQAVEDDPAFLRLQNQNSALIRQAESLKYETESEQRSLYDKFAQLERQRKAFESTVSDLKAKLDHQSDYHEIQRELQMLRSIELDVDEDEKDKPMNGTADTNGGGSLEQLLLSRNKKLSSEMTLMRVSRQELQEQMEELQEEFSRTNAELEKSQKLCSVLETDLEKMQEEASNVLPSSAMSIAGGYSGRWTHTSRRGRSSPTSSIISGYETKSPSGLEALRAGEPVGGGSGMLPMIQAQRDRFKQKNAELEDELSKTYATVTSLRQEVASLQKDNLTLYEKTRYISAYSRGSNTSSAAFSQHPSHTNTQTIPNSPLSQDRYRADYEAKISPFAAFRGRESARAYKRMSLPERIVFSITRMVLSTRTSRNLFAGYCLALHVLIILMLYWTGSVEVERHATHLGDATSIAAGLKIAQNLQGDDWQLEGVT